MTPRPLSPRPAALLTALALCGLTACAEEISVGNAGDGGGGSRWDEGVGGAGGAGGAGGEGGGAGCGPDELLAPDGCLAPPAPREVCGFQDRWLSHCPDSDRDCFVDPGCDLGVFAPWAARLEDCDPLRPQVNPEAVEQCNERDDDCDGLTDEDFAAPELEGGLGTSCEACGVPGKLECARGVGPERFACSTAAGQSANPNPPQEFCDGADDDCDGRIDEGCLMANTAPDPGPPAPCGPDRLAFTEAGAVILLEADAAGRWTRTPLTGPEAAAHHLTCQGDQLAWLSGGACEDPLGLRRCPGAAVVRLGLEGPINLTEPTTPGPPRFGWDDSLWWHTLIEGGPILVRHGPEGLTRPEQDLQLSDPLPAADGLLARRWTGDAAQITLRGGDLASFFDGPGQPGPPARSARWVAWAFNDGAGLWVRPLDGGEGFQPTLDPGPHGPPQLAGDTLIWRDGAQLTALDLNTGVTTPIARAEGALDFAVGAGHISWVADDGATRRLWRTPLPADPQAPAPPPPAPGG